MDRLIDEYRMDKSKIEVTSLHDAPRDKDYWLAKSDNERLEGIEFMRQVLYGYDPSAARLQRVLEIVELGTS